MTTARLLQRHLEVISINGDVEDVLERLQACTWLLKDFGWCMLLWPVAWPAAVAAISIEFYLLLLSGTDGISSTQFIHRCAFCLWLLANATWMTSEFLFEPSVQPGRQYPWFHGPLSGPDATTYWTLVVGVRFILSVALCMLLVFYSKQAYIATKASNSPAAHEPKDDYSDNVAGQAKQDPLVFGCMSPDIYKMVFVGPWIAKDLCWTFDLLLPALCLACIVGVLMLDYVRRYGGLQLISLVFWVLGNTVWVVNELWPDDSTKWPRQVAAACLLGGLVVVCMDWLIAKRTASNPEATALLNKSGC